MRAAPAVGGIEVLQRPADAEERPKVIIADFYLLKPFENEKVFEIVRRGLEGTP